MHSEHRAKRQQGVLPPRVLAMSLLAQIPLLAWSWPLHSGPLELLAGAALLLAGAVLNVWADDLFRKNGVGVCPFSDTPVVVAGGPYRWTRNPMYLGLVLISAGPAVLTGVYWNLASAAVLLLWLHFRFVLPEEMFLQDRLGAEYLTYASANPRWIGLPGPKTGSRAAAGRAA